MPRLKLNITTPERIVFDGNVDSVTVPGTAGRFQVLYNHAPLISTLEIGSIKIDTGTEKKYYSTGGGTIEVLNNNINILADSVESAEEIDVERAENARKRAEERLAKKNENIDLQRAEAALRRAVNRLNIVNKYVRGLA